MGSFVVVVSEPTEEVRVGVVADEVWGGVVAEEVRGGLVAEEVQVGLVAEQPSPGNQGRYLVLETTGAVRYASPGPIKQEKNDQVKFLVSFSFLS